MPPDRATRLRQLEKRLGYRFLSLSAFDRALTHKSFVYENLASQTGGRAEHYERLEFLGDSILGLVISEYLFLIYPEYAEGELSKMKSFLVSANQLQSLSLELGLGDYMRLSRGEEKTGGRKKRAILADLFESVVAAIYLDGGLVAARRFILEQFSHRFQTLARKTSSLNDHKSTLQEQLHASGLLAPEYRVLEESGPDHQKQFLVEVRAGEEVLGQGRGRSKKQAQQRAAATALSRLKTDQVPCPEKSV
ncbi:MAG: ribonuclease III [Acidobacteriota bacterium]